MNRKFIEVTGVPCCGKSTYLSELDITFEKKFEPKNIYYEIRYLLFGLLCLKLTEIFKFAILSYRENAPLMYRFNIFRNVVRKFGLDLHLQRLSVELFVDEGITHIPFNFLRVHFIFYGWKRIF